MKAHYNNADNYEILLMEYAAGTLDMAQTLIVSAHLSMSPEARKIVKECECLGGALIEKNCEPVAMSAGSLESIMNKLDSAPAQTAARAERFFPEDAPLPTCVDDYVSCLPGKHLRWRSIYPGIDSFALPLECRQSKAHVFRTKPGVSTPRHRHTGMEITLVLKGAIADDETWYKKGNLVIADEASDAHAPQSCPEQGCICLTVVSGSLQMTGFLTRFLNPFLRF